MKNISKNQFFKILSVILFVILVVYSFPTIWNYYSFDIHYFIARNAHKIYQENHQTKFGKIAEENYNESLKALATNYNHDTNFKKSIIIFELAQLFSDEEKYIKANNLYQTLLESRIKQFGEFHISVVAVYDRLGCLNLTRKQYNEAETYFLKALKTYEDSLSNSDNFSQYSKESPDFLYDSILKNLIILYFKQKKFDKLEAICFKAMDFYKIKNRNIDYADTLAFLGYIYEIEKNYSGAEKAYISSITAYGNYKQEKKSSVINDLRLLYLKQNKLKEANSL